MKRFVSAYFNSYWIPFALVILVGIVESYIMKYLIRSSTVNLLEYINYTSPITSALYRILLFGLLSAGLWNLYKKRWAKGLVNILIPVLPLVLMFGIQSTTFDDNFTAGLVIPDNIEISLPLQRPKKSFSDINDAFQTMLLDTLHDLKKTPTSLSVSIPSLVTLHMKNPKFLLRYLASSPEWRVFTERGNQYATKRWMIGSEWHYKLHGYYSRRDFERYSEASVPDFSSRITIGLSGKPWASNSWDKSIAFGEKIEISSAVEVKDLLRVSSDALSLELYDKSDIKPRITETAIRYLNRVFDNLLNNQDSAFLYQHLPENGIKRGTSSLELIKTHSPGIYNVRIWINPREAGMLYLKAFEVTKNTPLSSHNLKKYSNEWIGYSEETSQQFLSNTHFTIFEGDWGKPYAARFEVWFQPDNAKPERKLMEKVFKIEGWQR